MNRRNMWLVACVVVLLCSGAAAQDDFGPITPNTLRVEPLRPGGAGSWILVKDHREIGSPTFSPDGEWIAFDGYERGFYGSDAAVWIVGRDGKDLHKLTTGATPRWSPDGKQLMFMRDKSRQPDGKLGIFIIDKDGKNERWICPGRWPDWSPDGKQIAFTRDYRDVPSSGVKSMARVYVANPDGSNAKVIVDGDCPSWSPDGKKIACSYRDPAGTAPVLRIFELEAGRQWVTGYGWYRANWSPDAKTVVANGYGVPAGTKMPAAKAYPYPSSPDGVAIAAKAYVQGRLGIVEISALKPALPVLLFPKYLQPSSPCYSADGKYMVFVARRPVDDPEK
jgi:dipeptidyl aminopeptidase/acylaminoacyl peptidase